MKSMCPQSVGVLVQPWFQHGVVVAATIREAPSRDRLGCKPDGLLHCISILSALLSNCHVSAEYGNMSLVKVMFDTLMYRERYNMEFGQKFGKHCVF